MIKKEKRSFEEFIKVMSERNNHEYDYSLVSKEDYYAFGSERFIPIVCKTHGTVMVNQKKHSSVKGCKCPKCIEESKELKSANHYINAKEKQTQNMATLLDGIYGNKDLYYVYMDDSLTIHIDCLKHGSIRTITRYSMHVDLSTASQKCTKCKDERIALLLEKKRILKLKRPQKLFRQKLENILQSEPNSQSFAELIDNVSFSTRDTSRYSYSYVHDKINKMFKNHAIPHKIPVICNKHGEYISNLQNHIDGRSNCQVCAGIARISKEDCLKRFINVHQNKFDYSRFKFKSMGKKSIIKCIKHDHWFKTTPSNHLICETSGGCKLCSQSGFDTSKPGTLYYISINNGQAYKIGITNHSVKKRFLKDPGLDYKIIATFDFELGLDALNKETEIKRQFKDAKYTGEPLLLNGNTELFSYDILGLDT